MFCNEFSGEARPGGDKPANNSKNRDVTTGMKQNYGYHIARFCLLSSVEI